MFETLGLYRVGFGASAENLISIRAMESVGCKKEGLLRSFLPNVKGDGRTDIVLLSLLREEWQQYARAALKAKLKAVHQWNP